jgi:hypothetical protein
MLYALAAVVVAHMAAVAFFPAIGLRGPFRAAAWLVCSVVVALSPCLVPLRFREWRFLSTLVAIGLLTKMYDVFRSGDHGFRKGFAFYLTWLPNSFWLVVRRVPPPHARRDDWKRLSAALIQTAAGVALLVRLFDRDWSRQPFALEHGAKVTATFCTVVSFSRMTAAAYRLSGRAALDPMLAPATAPTPAEFWRRWNRPAQQFLETYAFRPAGGVRDLVRATLVTFAVSAAIHEYVFGIAAGRVQGWQALFFLVQGVAAAASIRLRPTGWRRTVGQLLTFLFNLATSAFFFRSVNAVLQFYSPRSS